MFLDDIVGPMGIEEAKATKQRLDAKCWKGYKKQGTKVKGGVRVNNCVPTESQLNELAAGYAANKGYNEIGAYKRYNTFVSKKKFNNLAFIAVAENPRTNEVKFKATAPTQQEAVQKLHAEIDKEIEVATKVSGSATVDFNVDFVRDVLEMSSNTFYAKIIPGPKLVIAGKEMEQYPDIMKQEGFKASSIRTVSDSEGATKLPAMPLSAGGAATAQLIANGRYVLGAETIDRDGNRIFDLEFDSQVADPRERIRMGVPAITIGTKREAKEDSWHGQTDAWHAGDNAWSSENHEMVETENDWSDDEDEEETDLRSGDYVRDRLDGEHGEIFRMQGDPNERRVQILDRDGRGWYITTDRLTRVDPDDINIQRYFGKRRQRDMDESGVAEASFTAAASMHAATRKRDPQRQEPKHDFRVGDNVVTKKGKKPGEVVFVDGEKIHVKGTNPYYPNEVTYHTASELKKGVAEADETSWTANSAQFRKEEDMSWPVEITLEPNADINQGRGRQVKTMTVTGQSRDAAKKKLVDYFLKNGWTVTGIKFTSDLDEARRVKGGDYQLKLVDKQSDNDTDLDDVVMDYYFDVYQNGQKIGTAEGDSYYGELVVKPNFDRQFKLSSFHDKDHPLMQQFEKIENGLAESATAPIIVPKRRAKEKKPTKFHIPHKASDYVPPAVALARDEEAKKKKGVAEAQLDEATARDVILGLLDKFYADMKLPPRQGSHSGALDIKSPGTKVWTRGDGTRLRDPGRIQASHWADDKKQAEKAASKFWPWLLKQPGVKSIGQVSGQFGSSPMTDAVSYKGLYFSGGPYGTEFGSMSRVKNPKSVWRHKPFELEPKAEQGVAEDWIDDDAAEPLARYFADLYYGDFSATEKVKLTAHIYQAVINGELSIDQLKADIDMLEKEKGLKEQGVAEGRAANIITAFAIAGGALLGTWSGHISNTSQQRWMQAYEQIKQTDPATAEQIKQLVKKYRNSNAKTGPDVFTSRKIDKIIKDFEEQHLKKPEVDEGWSDKYGGVMRPPTPYSVYIKGKKWKDFSTDDHARAVMDKLKAKFAADGRDPETITIAPTDYDKNVKEAGSPSQQAAIAIAKKKEQGVAEAEDDKVRQLTTMEYRHISFLARKAGIVLGGLGADKVTGDLYWSGTKDGRNVSGVVKRTVSDADLDHEEAKYKAELEREKQLDELSPQTLRSYIKKSKGHSQKYDQKGNRADEKGDEELANKMWNKGDNRYAGAEQARAKLAGVNENTNYWTKLQNQRNTKLNKLVNELKESINK